MNNWQELMDYVYGEIDYIDFFKDNKPNMHNLLALANESLLGLTVDFLSFTNTEALSDALIVDMPNGLVEVFKVQVNGEDVERCNMHSIQFANDLAYVPREFKIMFNKKFSCGVGDFSIIGKGKFDLFTKSPTDKRFFELMPLEYHYLPAYFILQRLFIRAGDMNKAQYYMQMYNDLYKRYDWSLVVRRTKEAQWQVNYTKTEFNDYFYKIYADIPTVYHSFQTITPGEVDGKIQTAVNSIKDWTYSKGDIDTKDSGVLSEAENYTYSKDVINRKDTARKNEAVAYTDEKVGQIEDAIDEILGE